MSDHRFTIGQTVRLKGTLGRVPANAETYRIMATLPPLNNSPQYRIRNDAERHDRVTTEDRLERAHGPQGRDDVFRK